MKKNYLLLTASTLVLTFFTSCIDSDYSLSDLNKEAVFSYENGIYLPLGNFDTIRFEATKVDMPVKMTYTTVVEGLFSEDLYDKFVITRNGKDEPLGLITFTADFIANISRAAEKSFSDFTLSSVIVKENGEDTGILLAEQVFKSDIPDVQAFQVVIEKEDVPKLKDASILHLIFTFTAKEVEWEDYVLLNDMKIKSSGGIKFSLD
jgi:hypothetical protein